MRRGELPTGARLPQDAERLVREQYGLVEAATLLPCAEKRHRHDQHLLSRKLFQLQRRLRKMPPQKPSYATDTREFKQTNQCPQFARVSPKADGAFKGRRRHAALPTEQKLAEQACESNIFHVEREVDCLATAPATRQCLSCHISHAGSTHRNGPSPFKWPFTNSAGRRDDRCHYIIYKLPG